MFKQYIKEMIKVSDSGGKYEMNAVRDQIEESYETGLLTWKELNILFEVMNKLN